MRYRIFIVTVSKCHAYNTVNVRYTRLSVYLQFCTLDIVTVFNVPYSQAECIESLFQFHNFRNFRTFNHYKIINGHITGLESRIFIGSVRQAYNRYTFLIGQISRTIYLYRRSFQNHVGSGIQHRKLYRIRNCRHFDKNTVRVFPDNLNFLYKVLIVFFCNPHFIFPGLQPHACLPFVIRLFLYVIYCDVCFRNINTSVSVNYSKIYIHFCKEHSLKYIYWLIFDRKYTFYGLETRFFKLVFIGSRLQINDRLSIIVRF